MQGVAIVFLCVLAAIVYGIVHDQITARICVEYFTIGHPRIVASEDPTVLGIVWGVVATWWAGAILGVPLAIVARIGSRPPRTLRSLLAPLAALLLIMGLAATLAALVGRGLAETGGIRLYPPLSTRVPSDRHVDFLTALWAHSASYLVGFGGGLVLIVFVALSRARPAARVSVGPPADVTIVPATHLDQPGWLALRMALWPECAEPEHRREMSAFLRQPERYAQFLALVEGLPVGLAEASLRREEPCGATKLPAAYLEGIYVTPRLRGRGVGRALVAAVAAWGRTQGATELVSDATLDDVDSQAFHRHIGFEEIDRTVLFRRALAP